MRFIVDIVTGSSQGIGKAIAESIAHHRSVGFDSLSDHNMKSQPPKYGLFLVGRNQQRGEATAKSIQKEWFSAMDHHHNHAKAYFEPCDVSNYKDVFDLKGRIEKRLVQDLAISKRSMTKTYDFSASSSDLDYQLGIVVNNAAECPRTQKFAIRPRRKAVTDGIVVAVFHEKIDQQFATNVLGYHSMIKVFEPKVSTSLDVSNAWPKSATTHIVNVASNWAGDLDLNDLHFQQRRYDNDTSYRQSKQCNRMLSKIWSERLSRSFVNSCHPGDPCTTLSTALGNNTYCNPPSRKEIELDQTIPYLCGLVKSGSRSGDAVLSTTGGWYDGGTNPSRCRFGDDTSTTAKNCRQHLYDICDSFAVLKPV